MKYILALALLVGSAFAQLTTNSIDVCDGQIDYIAAMKPMVDQWAKNIVPPYGYTTDDVSKYLSMSMSFAIGSRCSWMRVNDRLTALENQLQVEFNQIGDLQKRVTALEGKPAGTVDLSGLQNDIASLKANVALMQGQIKTAGTALAH